MITRPDEAPDTAPDTALLSARRVAVAHDLDEQTVARIDGVGFANHVFVAGQSNERCVIRFPVDGRGPDVFTIEEWCLKAATEAGIATPAFVARGSIDGRPYLIQRFVAGEPGSDLSPAVAWRELGEYAARVAAIPVTPDAPGGLFSRFGRDLGTAWGAHVSYNLDALGAGDPLIALGAYAIEDEPALRAALDDVKRASFGFGLLHGDLAPRNLIARLPAPSVLIDWGAAHTGPAPWRDLETVYYWHIAAPFESIGQTVDAADLAAFADGCGIRLAAAIPLLERMLVLRYLDLVRWARDRRPDLLDGHLEETRIGVVRYLNQATKMQNGWPAGSA